MMREQEDLFSATITVHIDGAPISLEALEMVGPELEGVRLPGLSIGGVYLMRWEQVGETRPQTTIEYGVVGGVHVAQSPKGGKTMGKMGVNAPPSSIKTSVRLAVF